MKQLLAIAGAHKTATAVVVAAVVAAGGAVHAVVDDTTSATVVEVVDGDTIDVDYDGATHRVRLLNVDTPESVDPEEPVECLGPEASDWLEQRLPVGTEVRLEWDQDTRDNYGRELAAVFVGSDLVNAEITRAGLGVPMSVAPNTEYLPPVQAAHAEARNAGRGLYAAEVECTLPVLVEQAETVATQTIEQAPAATAGLDQFDSYATELAAAAATAGSVLGILDGDVRAFPLVAYDAGELGRSRARMEAVERRLDAAAARNSTARTERQRQIEAEEAARRAAEEAARRAAEEAARRAAEEAARRAAEE
ncbi:MAG: thermonuclease family protein, partial [Actinomycetota bacterium]|nr:thermonuclease family protein [Actinomycetota bacterium]